MPSPGIIDFGQAQTPNFDRWRLPMDHTLMLELHTPVQTEKSAFEPLDEETTLANNSHDIEKLPQEKQANEKQFDLIASYVNRTILELSVVYKKIGYSRQEIKTKESEIFTILHDSISNFSTSLQRQMTNIDNECEWLRQQIQVILSMINDANGEKNLSLLDRGLIFNDTAMYEQGYKQNILQRLTQKQNFYINSPFNVSQYDDDDDDIELSVQEQYEYMSKDIPPISLLQLKTKLNDAFLKILKAFVKLFKKFNDMNLQYLEATFSIGMPPCSETANIVDSFPSYEEAKAHRNLIVEFEDIVENLKSKDVFPSELATFIQSSPRKSKLGAEDEMRPEENDYVTRLRDVNYQIVRVIRSLKFTKITSELLATMQQKIQACQAELEKRATSMTSTIDRCLEFISLLQLTDDQLITIQKQHNLHQEDKEEVYFEIETLTFIRANPVDFGLNDTHLAFISKFANLLERITESKQRKISGYLKRCRYLWEKLGENDEYIDNFVLANSPLTDISLMNYKMELNKLYLKRSQFIDSFIDDARSDIEQYWNKMYYSEEQRKSFPYFQYDSLTEAEDKERILSCHEQELLTLKEQYQLKEPIFKLYGELNELIQDQAFLLESSKNSSRLLSKNSCKILLNEEKIRKRINKNMPKLFSSLKSEISTYNNQALKESKQPIQINGEDFFERVLILESEHLKTGSSRGKNMSPSRISSSSSVRASPVKVKPTPQTTSKPRMSRRSPMNQSPTKENLIKKPALKREFNYTNPTKIRLTNAINSSMSSNSSVSTLESPRSRGSISSSTIVNTLSTQLQPLNSPLTYMRSPTHSSISRDSPLRINQNLLNVSKLSPKNILMMDSKENSSLGAFSPVPLDSKLSATKPNEYENSTRMSILTCDSSGILGDDYQAWKDERIKQFQ